MAGSRVQTILAIAFVLALGVGTRAAADEVQAPQAAVDRAQRQVLAILADPSLSRAEQRGQIEAIAYENFDFEVMSKLVLSRDWKRFDSDQRVRFIAEFRRELSRNYGSRLDRYQDEQIETVGERPEQRGDVTVLSKVVGGQFDGVEINYRLRRRDDRWLGIDVVIEGVSLVSSYRSQFRDVVSKGGPEELLRRLADKNASADDAES